MINDKSTQTALSHRRMELMGPKEIEAALSERSLVYLPLDAMEWHGQHLPFGLDSLTSSGVCLRAAERAGGVVYPPLYYGMWATIWHHPWTVLAEEEEALRHLLMTTLRRLEDCGVEKAILFTGHFATQQLDLLKRLLGEWQSEDERTMGVKALSISELPDSPMKPDHGALFETSVLSVLEPELVKLDRLPSMEEAPANDPEGDPYGEHRRDPENVLFGVLGKDPRELDTEDAAALVEQLVDWVVGEAEG